jgi:hypothetical protein
VAATTIFGTELVLLMDVTGIAAVFWIAAAALWLVTIYGVLSVLTVQLHSVKSAGRAEIQVGHAARILTIRPPGAASTQTCQKRQRAKSSSPVFFTSICIIILSAFIAYSRGICTRICSRTTPWFNRIAFHIS